MAEKGTNYEPWPLDALILTILPKVGTIGGIHWKGRRVKDVAEQLRGDGYDVTNALVHGRLRSMGAADMVKAFGAQDVHVWAKTPKGVEYETNNGSGLPAVDTDDSEGSSNGA